MTAIHIYAVRAPFRGSRLWHSRHHEGCYRLKGNEASKLSVGASIELFCSRLSNDILSGLSVFAVDAETRRVLGARLHPKQGRQSCADVMFERVDRCAIRRYRTWLYRLRNGIFDTFSGEELIVAAKSLPEAAELIQRFASRHRLRSGVQIECLPDGGEEFVLSDEMSQCTSQARQNDPTDNILRPLPLAFPA